VVRERARGEKVRAVSSSYLEKVNKLFDLNLHFYFNYHQSII